MKKGYDGNHQYNLDTNLCHSTWDAELLLVFHLGRGEDNFMVFLLAFLTITSLTQKPRNNIRIQPAAKHVHFGYAFRVWENDPRVDS